jgi:DNA-binding transcriptional MerR regulator
MPEEQLTIGELASRTGVATSALRYWEEIGLLPAPTRVSGQRRYDASVTTHVGEVLLLREAGYTLRELKALFTARENPDGNWRELARRKLAELDHRIARVQAARTLIAHGLACPHEDVRDCSNHASVIAARLAGATLEEAHGH